MSNKCTTTVPRCFSESENPRCFQGIQTTLRPRCCPESSDPSCSKVPPTTTTTICDSVSPNAKCTPAIYLPPTTTHGTPIKIPVTECYDGSKDSRCRQSTKPTTYETKPIPPSEILKPICHSGFIDSACSQLPITAPANTQVPTTTTKAPQTSPAPRKLSATPDQVI